MFISLMAAKGVGFTWTPWIFLNANPASHGWCFFFFSGGLAHQISAQPNASVALELVLRCLLQTGSSSTTGEMKCFNTTRSNGEKRDKGGVEIKNCSAELIFSSMNKTRAGTHTSRMESRNNMAEKGNSKQNRSGINTTDTSRKEEPGKKAKEKEKKGGTQLRSCEVTLPQRCRSKSEVRQGER